jgi:hypothetical protein
MSSRRFGRNRPLPRRPPEIPRHVEIEDALRTVREQEMRRLTEAALVGGGSIQFFLIFCASWVAVVGGMVALFLAQR